MFNRFVKTSAKFLPAIPLRTLFRTRPVFRALQTPLTQPTTQSYPTIQARLMSTIPREPTQPRLNISDKEWLNKSTEKFKIRNPNASAEDIANYKIFYLLQLKRIEIFDKKFDNNIELYFSYTHDHQPNTLPVKNALLTMLNTPLDKIDKNLIEKTLKKIGFKTRQAIFQNTIELDLKSACDDHKPHEENLIYINTSKMIENAKDPNDLVTAYAYFLASPLTAEFKTSKEIFALEFLVNGRMNQSIYTTLQYNCEKFPGFANPTAQYLEENKREFNQLKPYFVTMLTQLEAIKDELAAQPTPSFPEFIEKIKSTKNSAELMHELFKQNECLGFNDWRKIRSNVAKLHMFDDPSRLREQLYFLMTDPDKRGIKFDFYADEALINDYMEYLRWNTRAIHKNADQCDDRGGTYRYLTATYGTYNPTNQDFLDVTLKGMKEALHGGLYQQRISEMRASIQHYHECTQPKPSAKLC